MKASLMGSLGLAVPLLLFAAATPARAGECADLANLELGSTKIHSATVTPPPFDPPENGMSLAQDGYSRNPTTIKTNRIFCRLEGYSRPTNDSFITFEIWLPDEWNQKFQAVGSGKVFGAINYPGLVDALNRGYAVVSTDSGHRSNRSDLTWAIGHPEKVIDLFYRADQVSAVAAKAAIKKFYGKDPVHSYYIGCARGGTSGLQMAARYPDLFDGIYAGSPGTNSTHKMANFMWMGQHQLLDPAKAIPPAKFAMITRAAIAACDGRDGLADGQITDPSTCPFEPVSILCKNGDADNCLTAAQVATLEKLYAGAKNPLTGEQVYVGRPAKGSEAGWPNIIQSGNKRAGFADTIGVFLYQKADWDWTRFDFGADLAEIEKLGTAFLDIKDPDLRAFGRKGKIIITHGWQDPLFSPLNAVEFYEGARKKSGGNISEYVRMFFAPGMGHCGGGSGPNKFDAETALENWVEKGVAPQRIIATKYRDDDPAQAVLRTRPLCPYPKTESYKGSGDINDASNFICK